MGNGSNSPNEISVTEEIKDVTSPLLMFAREDSQEKGLPRIPRHDPAEGYREVVASLADEITKIAGNEQDIAAARQLVQSHQKISELLNSKLSEVLTNLSRLEQVRERRERYSPDWFEQTLRNLGRSCSENPEAGFHQWIRVYAQALVDWEHDACDRLAKLDLPFPPHQLPYVFLIRHGDASIQKKEYQPAVRMLNYLVQCLTGNKNEEAQSIDEEGRLLAALILIFAGRIHLYQMDQADKAREIFSRSAVLAPRDGRPLAAQGHAHLDRGDEGMADANELFSRAIEFSPNEPDGYIGKALMAEARQLWNEADEWCRAAVQSQSHEPDLFKAFTKLLAPAPGRLFLQVAQQAYDAGQYERALRAVERSSELGVRIGKDDPSGAVPALKAETLVKLRGSDTSKQAKEIAELYLEAGKYYYWDNKLQIAKDLFEKGLALDDQNALIWFYAADNLRMLSSASTPPYYTNEKEVRQSLETWERGMQRVQHIGPPEAWVFVARSSIAKHLALLPNEDNKTLYWQSVLYIERALLLDKTPNWWANLSGSYNGLFLYANMLDVSRRAEEGTPGDVVTLEERAKGLINTGQFKPAEEILNKLRNNESIDPSIRELYRSWQAVIDFYLGNYQKALENIQPGLEAVRDDLWLISLRRNILESMGEYERAMEDTNWIWERRDDPKYKDEQFEFARAAFSKGMFQEAIGRLQLQLRTASGDERFTALLYSGMSNLALGEYAVAKEQLNESLEISNPRSLIDLISELDQLKQRSVREAWKNQAEIAAYLDDPEGVWKRAKEKQNDIKGYDADPIKELEAVLAGPTTGDKGSWSWLGTQASLGRLYVEADRKLDARRTYEALCDYSDLIPEAEEALKSLDRPTQ